ncbi:hypothetical protein LCGC14_0424380 [marine sediment metagenome]|uniref:Uncharacterized protein n=1 Tax=marine sediment metagenome TaxID=412755 RepID=A0A0F9VBT9_9ZZZZ
MALTEMDIRLALVCCLEAGGHPDRGPYQWDADTDIYTIRTISFRGDAVRAMMETARFREAKALVKNDGS